MKGGVIIFTVTIYDKSKKLFRTYKNMNRVSYIDFLGSVIDVSEPDIYEHYFEFIPNNYFHFFGENSNCVIDCSLIGSLEISTD